MLKLFNRWVTLDRICLFMISLMSLLAVVAPLIANHSPFQVFRGFENLSPSWEEHNAEIFVLGTDAEGRDVFSRLLFGGRYTIGLALVSVLISLAMGYSLSKWLKLNRSLNGKYPSFLLALLLMILFRGGMISAVLATGLSLVPLFVTPFENRAGFLSIFYSAFASSILTLSSLGFLNGVVCNPTPEWGTMVRAGLETFYSINPFVSLISGLAIFIFVLCLNILGSKAHE